MTETNVAAADPSMFELSSTLRLRFRGRVDALSSDDRDALFDRALTTDQTIALRTAEIIARVRRDGDDALRALAAELDGAKLDVLEVPRLALRRALDAIEPDLRRSLDRAAANIASVHRAFLPQTTETSPEPGILVGRRPDPLSVVGIYAPGGRAAYPSSVLMCGIPARIAGVREIVMCSPPGRDGLPPSVVLAAAYLAEVDRVLAIGGAGAIAAMTFGTSSVPRVDRIVGPGNAYVTEAKRQLARIVGIDSPAGPSELLILADDTSDPEIVARELIAQAEHDPLTCVVALAVGDAMATAIEAAIARQLTSAARRDIIDRALAGRGGVLIVDSQREAIEVANRYAPEHLLVALSSLEESMSALTDLRNAGTVFVGEASSNAFGDYMTGANHVLPTLGLARSYSGLSVQDFFRFTTYQRVDRDAASRLAPDVAVLAEAEGLPAHAEAARAWIDQVTNRQDFTRPTHIPVRPEVARLAAYRDSRDVGGEEVSNGLLALLDLSDNTNLWGSPPAAQDAVADASSLIARYPSSYSDALKRAVAVYLGLTRADIVVGCGSDDVIDATMRAFGGPGARIAYSTPTFSMIPAFAQLNGLTSIEVPLLDEDDRYDVDAAKLLATGANIIYLCAPNNPTGTGVSREALEQIIERAPGVVLIDEAYAEFSGLTNVDLAERSEHVIVTRTFSKAFGLAGLRVGYGVGAPPLVDFIERARGPYKVNAVAERAALGVLRDGPDALGWVREHARLACEARDRFVAALSRLGLEPFPSLANFVLVPIASAREIGARLRAHGVRVRVITGLPQALSALAATRGEALRISIGPSEAMDRVARVLGEVLSR